MLLALIILPLAAGLAAWFIRSHRLRRSLLVAAALGHAGLTGLAFFRPPAPALEGWLALDAAGLLFLAITSGLFLAVAVYALGYLAREDWARRQDFEEGLFFSNAREAVFTACLLAFLAMMTLVCLSQHFGLLWVAVEATTLASAPLLYFHRHRRSLEATWKYLLICSVGIALALLGNFFLAVAATLDERQAVPLVFGELMGRAGSLHAPWLKAAFIFLLVGYGTKQGLAPLHTWLPDAHSESPSLVSALLSGALLNCAFLAILRALGVCAAAGLGDFARELLVGFGLLSMLVAAGFILAQADYKRLLAYSSVEHMGIIALGFGIGGPLAVFGAVFHVIAHSLTKTLMFFGAGNVIQKYRTREMKEIKGLGRTMPATASLVVLGGAAIAGSPPFAIFIGELFIISGALVQGDYLVAGIFIALIVMIFAGMTYRVFGMVSGRPQEGVPDGEIGKLRLLPMIVLASAILALGLFLPDIVSDALGAVVKLFGVSM